MGKETGPEAILESITDGFYVLDRRWRFVYFNSRAEQYFKRGDQEVLGHTLWEVFPAVRGTAIEQRFHEAMAGGEPVHFEARSVVSGRWIEIHLYPSSQGLSVFFRDIHDRVEAQEALARREEELETILRFSPDVIGKFDRSYRPVYLSPSVERWTGHPPEHYLGRTPGEAGLSQEVAAAWEQGLGAVFATGREQEIEYEIASPRGLRYFSARLAPEFEADGTVKAAVMVARDVTEQRQAQEALRQSEALTTRILESSRDCVKLLSLDALLLSINAGGQRVLCLDDPAPLLGTPWLEFWKGEDRTAAEAAIEVARAGGTGRFTGFCPTFTGEPRWWDVVVTPMLSVEGVPEGLLAISRDVSEYREIEEALRVSESRFRQLAETIEGVFYITEPTGVKYVSPAYETIWKQPREHLYANPTAFLQAIHPEDRERVLRSLERQMTGETTEEEYRLVRPDGEERWVRDRAFPLKDSTGCVVRVFGVAEDLTERKRGVERIFFLAEASRLLASSLQYEATLQHVAHLMVPKLADWCVVDLLQPDGQAVEMVAVAHRDPEQVEWARTLRRQYPPRLDAAGGIGLVVRTGAPVLHPDVTDELLAAVAQDEEHLRLLRQAGLRSSLIVPLQVRGQVLGTITLVLSETNRRYTEEDLSFAEELAHRAAVAMDNARLYRDRQQAEARLRELNESLEQRVAQRTAELSRTNVLLQQRNQELRDFAYVASHDLQEPLRKISTFSGMLRAEFGDRLEASGQHMLERMESATGRMSQLISDLLAYSRVATQGQPFRQVDLRRVVEEVLSDLEVSLTEAQGTVEVGDLCMIEADPLQMRQLFQNLIGNALKYHRVEVAPLVQVRAQPGALTCRLEVEDNGIGFEERYAERIFYPFQRLHGRSQYPGTGIGLAICRRIVERHGGTISARSTPGVGSTFVVELPLSHPFEAGGDAVSADAWPEERWSPRREAGEA